MMSCPKPFLDERSFPNSGGDVHGRWCKEITINSETLSCCFSCPITSWRYAADLNPKLRIASWFGVAVLILAGILVLSYLALPVKETQRHYLTTSPLIGFVFMSAAFITPIVKTPQMCHDAITPNDWKSDPQCAISGSFIIYGVWVIVISCFFRSLSLYLHLRWEMDLGKRFMQLSVTCIFLGSAILLIIALCITGFSYQLGEFCYIGMYENKKTFWGPLIAVGILTFILQLMIMVYSIRVVLNPLQIEGALPAPTSHERSASANSFGSMGTAREASSRVWRILQMQWRAVVIVFAILLHIAFLTQLFLRVHPASSYSIEELTPWLSCLIRSKGKNMGNECLSEASHFGPEKNIVITAFCLLASSGFWGFFCVWRWSMVLAWLEWFKSKTPFISTKTSSNAPLPRRQPRDRHSYRPSSIERHWADHTRYSGHTTVLPSPTGDNWSYFTLDVGNSAADSSTIDSRTRDYKVPKQSFSTPLSPLSARTSHEQPKQDSSVKRTSSIWGLPTER